MQLFCLGPEPAKTMGVEQLELPITKPADNFDRVARGCGTKLMFPGTLTISARGRCGPGPHSKVGLLPRRLRPLGVR